MKSFSKRYPLLALLIFSFVSTSAQSVIGSAGTSFRFAFLPSMHAKADSVFVELNSDVATKGKIEYYDRLNVFHSLSFEITDPTRTVRKGIPCDLIELLGAVQDGVKATFVENEKVLKRQTVYISSEEPIRVLAISWSGSSSDATTILPEAACGSTYTVLAYRSSLVADATDPKKLDLNNSTPAQFVIVGLHDGTALTVTYRNATSLGTTGIVKINLQKGECYFAQSAVTILNDSLGDISGTTISADKPVAVFSGSQRLSLNNTPVDQPGVKSSFVMEQMIALEYWGTNAVLVPFDIEGSGTTTGSDEFKVVASYDATEVFLGTTYLCKLLKAGDVKRFSVSAPTELRASHPVLVASYQSSMNNGSSANVNGNASMCIVPATSHYSTKHKFVSCQWRISSSKLFPLQYIVVTAPTDAISSLNFDGETLNNSMIPIAGSDYSYTIRRVSDGLHTLSCDKPVGVLAYGLSDKSIYSYMSCPSMKGFSYIEPFLSVGDASADAGDTLTVSVRMDSIFLAPAILHIEPATISFNLKFNSTLLTPADPMMRGVISDGYQKVSVSSAIPANGFGTLLSIPLICGLGDQELSEISVSDCSIRNTAGQEISFNLHQRVGTFTLKNVWSDKWGRRLINPEPEQLVLLINPNPIREMAHIGYSIKFTAVNPVSLKIYDAMGIEKADLSEELAKAGLNGDVVFGADDLEAGVYFVRLCADDKSITRTMIKI